MGAEINTALWGLVVTLAGILAYFLRDAHVQFKDRLDQKADRKALDDAFNVYRADMKAMDERHKEEITRLERQYEVRFSGVVMNFTERINSLERNMGEKMDMILNVVDRRHTP